MISEKYSWKRFLCPREGTIHLDSNGFLADPDSKYTKYANPDFITFNELKNYHCVALLGEPGIGKSFVMNEEFDILKKNLKNDKILKYNLNEFGSQESLIDRIFLDDTFVSWKHDETNLYLFLDALDECVLNINPLISTLSNELNKCPNDRFFIRIACRVADWPEKLEKIFNEQWNEEEVLVYELAPLRRVDVLEAIEKNSINSDNFFKELELKKAAPLAIRPNTLQFLINVYIKHGKLFDNKFDLYLEGCKILCKESNADRNVSSNIGLLDPNERLIIASRIAAAMIFSNKKAIWTEQNDTDVPEEYLKISDIADGTEIVDRKEIKVNIKAINDTMRTGLFNGRIQGFGWSHQTFAEFLAAYYLIFKQVPEEKIMELIIHPFFIENEIVTNLKETITWISEKNRDVFFKLINISPDILLGTDLKVDNETKSLIVENLLNFFENGKLQDDYALSANYSKINHPKISEQLIPFIKNPKKNFYSRANAIRIGEACDLIDLPEILELSLDPSEDLNLRVKACYGISNRGNKDSREKLIRLINVDEDVDDELKGYALQAAWPDLIPAKDLFQFLTPPKRSGFIGGYSVFISNFVVQNLKPADFLFALKWISKTSSENSVFFRFDMLAYEILINAYDYLEEYNLKEEFARSILILMTNDDSFFDDEYIPKINDKLKSNEKTRRDVIKHAVGLYSKTQIHTLRASDVRLILNNDIPWMFNCLKDIESKEECDKWAFLIRNFFIIHRKEHRDCLKEFEKNNELPEDLKSIFISTTNYSRKIFQSKLRFKYRTIIMKSKKRLKLLKQYIDEFNYKQLIKKILKDFELGNLDKWMELNIELALGPKTRHYRYEFESDLTALVGWSLIDKKDHIRILDDAKEYIINKKSDTDKWFGTDKYWRTDLAAYRAIRLILKESPEFLKTINVDIWTKWIPIILIFPSDHPSGDIDIQREIIKLAYDKAPKEIIDRLKVIILKECEKFDFLMILKKLENVYDDNLDNLLLELLETNTIPEKCLRNIFDYMISNKSKKIQVYIKGLIKSGDISNAIQGCSSLLLNAEDGGWPIIWPNIDKNDLGKNIMPSISYLRSSENFMEKLKEEELGDLFIWMENNFPKSEDPKFDDAHFVAPREDIGHFRSSIPSYLKNKGTLKSLDAIKKIMCAFPDKIWLSQLYLEAKDITRSNKWEPSSPAEIIEITNNNSLYLIQSEYQLLNVVFESLSRLEKILRSETPAIQFLWNKDNIQTPKLWPIWENEFSDFVKLHLDNDLRNRGIIINREVQISKGSTDIHIDCISEKNGHKDTIKTIIETKGCWNVKLETAMKNQLLDQYIQNCSCNTGIYLVGWFYCDSWTEDNRKKATKKIGFEEAREFYKSQAEKLSNDEILLKAFVMDTRIIE